MPAVSVIIPVRNRASCIIRAVHSAARQRFRDLEILIGDDGSTDQTHTLVMETAAADHRIRILSWPTCQGVAETRNRLIEASDSRYVALLDSDDCWREDKLEQQLPILDDNPQTGVCHTLERWFRSGKEVKVPPGLLRMDEDPYLANLRRCTISPSSSVIRRSLLDRLGSFDPGLVACEDQDLWLRLARQTTMTCLPLPLTDRHGGRPDQLSISIPALDRFRIVCLLKQLQEEDLMLEYKKATLEILIEKAGILAGGSRKRKKPEQALLYDRLREWASGERENLSGG